MTYTYAIAEVSSAAYDEIRKILIDAGYQQAIHRDGETETLDMHGIGLRAIVIDDDRDDREPELTAADEYEDRLDHERAHSAARLR